MQIVATDRRSTCRYEVRLPLRYRVSPKGSIPRAGGATTLEMSTSGLSFRCRKPLPVGSHIELMIHWPARYADLYPVDLQATGFIVRCEGGRVGVRVTSCKFRVDALPAESIRATA